MFFIYCAKKFNFMPFPYYNTLILFSKFIPRGWNNGLKRNSGEVKWWSHRVDPNHLQLRSLTPNFNFIECCTNKCVAIETLDTKVAWAWSPVNHPKIAKLKLNMKRLLLESQITIKVGKTLLILILSNELQFRNGPIIF